MQLLDAWKESLSLFKPSNFKLFFLVTLKSLGDTCKVWFTYWWWLIGVYVLLAWHNSFFPEMLPFLVVGPASLLNLFEYRYETQHLYRYLTVITGAVLLIALFLSCRPSVRKKDYDYFFQYIKHSLWIICWFIMLAFIYRGFLEVLPNVWGSKPTLFSALTFTFIFFVYGALWAWVTSFYILFLCDSDGSWKSEYKSLSRAYKIFFYNLPFCVCMAFLFVAIVALTNVIILWSVRALGALPMFNKAQLFKYLGFIFDLLWAPLWACITTNFYVKKLHEQFTLYFGEKS